MSNVEQFVVAYAGYVALMNLVPGPWRGWKKGRQGKALDTWSITHVVAGVIAKAMGLTLDEFMVLGAANEFIEGIVRVARPEIVWGEPESGANVAADIGLNYLGYKVAEMLSQNAGS